MRPLLNQPVARGFELRAMSYWAKASLFPSPFHVGAWTSIFDFLMPTFALSKLS